MSSAAWKHSTLSEESSAADSDRDTSQPPLAKKSRKNELSDQNSDVSDNGSHNSRKSRPRNKSGSGSDSGTARSSSGGSRASSKKSKSRSGSRASGGNSSDSGTGGSGHSSQERGSNRARSNSSVSNKSGSPSGSPAAKKRRSRSPSAGSRSGSSPASPRKAQSSSPRKDGNSSSSGSSSSGSSSSQHKSDSSNSSNKSKKLKKSKDHKASSKLEKQVFQQDSEDEEDASDRRKSTTANKRSPKKARGKSTSEEEELATWRDEFDDGLDDDYIGDEQDRRMLESLTEREREEEFYRRTEKREELKKRFEISQKLKKQNKHKAGLSSSDREDAGSRMGGGERGSSETRSMSESYSIDPMSRKKGYEEKYGSKFSALSELKAKREEKERKEKMREEKMKKKKKKGGDDGSDSASGSDYEKLGKKKKGKNVLKARDIYSSSSSDEGGDVRRKTSSSSSSSSSQSSGESDTERQNTKKTVKKAMNIETLQELEKIRLSRFKLDKFVHLPIFKRTVIGCFVKIGIGKSPEGKDVYRCCEIVDTCETGKIYNVMKTKTNVGLKLRFGKDTKIFRLQFVSNQQVLETEFESWRRACIEGNLNLPTVSHIQQKMKDIKYALEYRFSTADVEKILASKKKFNKSPKNFAMHKAMLTKERDTAQFGGDIEKAADLQKQLDEIEKRAEELDNKRTSTISSISLVNDRNRKNNIARAYTGIKQEERRRQIEGETDDPFTRRKTKPRLGNTKSRNAEPEQEMTSELLKKLEDEKKAKEAEEVAAKKKAALEIKPIFPATTVDFSKAAKMASGPSSDIFDAHNFELDINVDEIQSTSITPSISLKPVNASSAPAGPIKRSLKLDEWKKKRGMI